MGVFNWSLLLNIFSDLNVLLSIGKSVSNKSMLTDRVTFGTFGSFHLCYIERHSEYLVVSDAANFFNSILTFALSTFL